MIISAVNEYHTESAILPGTVAIREPDQLLEWDSVKMEFPNYMDANKYLGRVSRKDQIVFYSADAFSSHPDMPADTMNFIT
jgi:hypothetical protein